MIKLTPIGGNVSGIGLEKSLILAVFLVQQETDCNIRYQLKHTQVPYSIQSLGKLSLCH